MTSEMQKRLAALKAQKEKEEISQKNDDVVALPVEPIVEKHIEESAPKTTKKKVEPKPRAPKKETDVKKETKVPDEPRVKLPLKRLNGHALADAIDAMTPEQIEDSGMGVLKAVLHRHAKRSISMMDAIVTVIMKMINDGYEF